MNTLYTLDVRYLVLTQLSSVFKNSVFKNLYLSKHREVLGAHIQDRHYNCHSGTEPLCETVMKAPPETVGIWTLEASVVTCLVVVYQCFCHLLAPVHSHA